jgi:hypothetical protein
MKRLLLLGILGFFLLVMLMPYTSQAVPSYARQVKKPCTGCHTIWPNLNQYGRQFKVKAYTDVSQEWEMINKDNMNLTTTMPLSARVLYYPLVREDNNNPNGPMGTFAGPNDGTNKTGQSSTNLNQVSVFIASRIFDYGGVFTAAEADGFNGTFAVPTVKAAFQYPLGEGNTIGLVAFTGLAASADPFNSLGGRDRDLSFDKESLPWVLSTGWTFNFWSGNNIGEVVHGYFLGNRLYAALGVMRGGAPDDASGGALTGKNTTDPNDMYSRIAWDQKLPNGAITFGAAYYDGTQRIVTPTMYDSKVKRTYVDLSLEQNYGEDHIVEVQALYGSGEDKNVFGGSEDRKFDGFYVQGSYFYDRRYGVVASINDIKFKNAQTADFTGFPPNVGLGLTNAFGADKIDSWLVGVTFMPWLNTKLGVQYVNTKTKFVSGVSADTTDKISRVVLDILF